MPAGRAPHIVCFAPYTDWSIHSARQVTILQALRLRGATASYVACDGFFSQCDLVQAANGAPERRPANVCLTCQSSVAARLAAWGMPYRWLGRWAALGDAALAANWVAALEPFDFATAEYGPWQIGAWVRSSVHTHFRHNRLDLDEADVRAVFAEYLYNGLLAALALDRLFEAERPDAQLLFNGRMGPTRIALELAKARGIRTICEERSYVAGRLTLFDNANCLDLAAVDALWDAWRNVPLTAAEIGAVGDVLTARWRGTATDISAFSRGVGGGDVRAQLGIGPTAPLWVLFTSSLDESIDEPRSGGVFPSQAAWIEATVACAAAQPEVRLVIRVHPNVGSDRSLGRNRQDAAYFSALAAALPANVHLVASDDPLSSYALAAAGDLGLIWYSTIGLEMAAMGRHVVRAGYLWLADRPFLTAAAAPADYPAFLSRLRTRLSAADLACRQVLAWRFAYVWYFRQSIDFPLVRQPKWYLGEPAWTSPADLAPGRDPGLDRICAVFLEGAALHGTTAARDATLAIPEARAIAERTAAALSV